MDLLRRFLPDECAFLSDRVQPASRLRLRLCGESFPPTIVYKIFLQQAGPCCTGRQAILPGSVAACEAMRLMGPVRALECLLEVQPQGYRGLAADDESARHGGRHNVWQP